MREQLLNNSKGLYLQKTRSTPDCVYSGDPIQKGVHAIAIRQECDGYSCIAWLSIGALDDFLSIIEQFNPEEETPKHSLTPSDRVNYAVLAGEKQYCGICGEHMEKGVEGISIYNPSGNGDIVWIHLGCHNRLSEGLERVWDYTDEILPEII